MTHHAVEPDIAGRIALTLQPFTSNDYNGPRNPAGIPMPTTVQQAINDAFNLLEWGKTIPEEEEEEEEEAADAKKHAPSGAPGGAAPESPPADT